MESEAEHLVRGAHDNRRPVSQETLYSRAETISAHLSNLGRGLHSLTSQLNLSAFYGMGAARRGCVAHVKGVLGGVKGVFGCQTRLKLS